MKIYFSLHKQLLVTHWPLWMFFASFLAQLSHYK